MRIIAVTFASTLDNANVSRKVRIKSGKTSPFDVFNILIINQSKSPVSDVASTKIDIPKTTARTSHSM